MAEEWIVRGPRAVELADIVTGLGTAVPELSLRADETQRWIVVVGDDDVPQAWIGLSREVAGPRAESIRWGLPVTDAPCWTEVAGAWPSLVELVAEALAAVTGGSAARRSTVPPGSDPASRPAGDCPVDIVLEVQALLLSSATTVALTPWIVEATTWAHSVDRSLVLLTPRTTSITRAVGSHLVRTGGTWAVDAGDGLYDGLTGSRLATGPDGLHPTNERHPAHERQPEAPLALAVDAEILHEQRQGLAAGWLAGTVADAAGTPAPSRIGLLEPPAAPLDLTALTMLAQEEAPVPVRAYAAATTDDPLTAGCEATITLAPGPAGLLEHAAVMCSATELPWAPSRTATFARDVLGAGASLVVAGCRATAPGRLAPPRSTSPMTPLVVAFSLSRYPGLPLEEALALGGPASAVDADLHSAVITAPAQDPVDAHARLLGLLTEHDVLAH